MILLLNYIWQELSLSKMKRSNYYCFILSLTLATACGQGQPDVVAPGNQGGQAVNEKAPRNKTQVSPAKSNSSSPANSPKGSGEPNSSPNVYSILHEPDKTIASNRKNSLRNVLVTNKDLDDPLLMPVRKKPTRETVNNSKAARDEEVIATEFQRRSYLSDPFKKPKENSYLKRYGRDRLAKVATIKRYAPVTILPVQLEAHCRTAWDRGKLHVRVAYMGPPHNLKVFMEEQHMLHVSFQDEAGAQLYNFQIPISQMKKAPDSVNFGMPTYEVEGQLPLPLEVYEQFFQWNLEWS